MFVKMFLATEILVKRDNVEHIGFELPRPAVNAFFF